MYVNKSFSIDNVSQLSAGSLKKLLGSAPETARVTVHTHKADRNLSDYHSMTISWREEVK